LVGHDQHANNNQNDTGNNLNLVQVLAKVFVKPEKLVDAEAR
jgi:hypothetical protein